MPVRCFSCENDDTSETATPVKSAAGVTDGEWPADDGSENLMEAYQYRCSFCSAMNIRVLAENRHRNDWKKKVDAAGEATDVEAPS